MSDLSKIRNFSIIAHVDHGKSTLADRMLEETLTIEKRKMKEQVLDSMELERERGITIKMQPVRMEYKFGGENYVLNLIDTPGHIDFSYEVSRALKAVEGTILLVDSTQGVQAQTITVLNMAEELGLKIIPVITKTDLPSARVEEVKREIVSLINCNEKDILEVSGKTGAGVKVLIEKIIQEVPIPKNVNSEELKALVFDFHYSNHTGVILYVRIVAGEVSKHNPLKLLIAKEKFSPIEVGIFKPKQIIKDKLMAGEIGYIVTGIKSPGIASVGDTVALAKNNTLPLSGYMEPKPVVWASIFPENQAFKGRGGDEWNLLRQALLRLKLSDASLTFEEESSGVLGRGFRCGFLGMLHLEIIIERIKREFNLNLIVTSPSIRYRVIDKKGHEKIVYSPAAFPEYGLVEKVYEPWIKFRIITPDVYLGGVLQVLYDFEADVKETGNFGGGRNTIDGEMPLRELMRNFFDNLKSVSSGFASLAYEISDEREASVARLDVLVADEIVPAFTKIVSKRRVDLEAKASVEKLFKILPKQLFAVKIQSQALGRIISSRTLSAMRKDVTGYLYGGDVNRKMKLLEQQKKGKKRMKERGKVNIPHDIFVKMMKGE